MKINEVMNQNVKVINKDKTLFDAAKMMKDNSIGSIPVESDDRLVGMLTDRDIVLRSIAESKNANDLKVEDCMSPGINYCFDYQTTDEATEKMLKHSDRRLPVLNKDKRLVGIVSMGDLAKKKAYTATETLGARNKAH